MLTLIQKSELQFWLEVTILCFCGACGMAEERKSGSRSGFGALAG